MQLKDLLIVGLVCANVTLAALGVALWADGVESRAVASAESRAGDYIMVTGALTSSREGLAIVDTVAQRMNLYVPKAGTTGRGTQWELKASRNLKADFGT